VVPDLSPLRLLGLPIEILIRICTLLEDPDLPEIRRTCRKLCDAATRHFALVNFTERVHVVTAYSINALVDITAHPVVGGYVKTVSICSVRRTTLAKDYTLRSVIDNRFVSTQQFGRALEQVLGNIKQRSGSVNITIYDNPDKRNLGHWPGHVLSSKIGSMSIKCYGWKDFLTYCPGYITYRTAETLEETVWAARRAECQIACLKVNLFAHYNPRAQAQLQRVMENIL
jgi:hypothetical protein